MKEKIITLTQEEADKINKEGKAIGVCIDTLEDEEYKDTLDSGFFPLEKEPIEDIGSEEQDPKEIIDYFDPWLIKTKVERIKKEKIAIDWQLPFLYNRLLESTQPSYYGSPDNFYSIYQEGDYEVIREHLFEDIETSSKFRTAHLKRWMEKFPKSQKGCFWDFIENIDFDLFNDPKKFGETEPIRKEIKKALRKNLWRDPDIGFKDWIYQRALEFDTAYKVGYYKKINEKQFNQRKKFLLSKQLPQLFGEVVKKIKKDKERINERAKKAIH